MKSRLLFIIILLGTTFSVFAQKSHKKHFSPEITLSFNYVNKNLLDAYGFGAGLYNVFFNQKRCNLITGLEYNVVFRNIVLLEDDFPGHYHYIGITMKIIFFFCIIVALNSCKKSENGEKETLTATLKIKTLWIKIRNIRG